MDLRRITRIAALTTGALAPLGLGGCAYPPYRYYSAPCAPAASNAAITGATPAPQVVPGSGGKQCMYAAPDYAYGGYSPYSTYEAGAFGPYDFWDNGFGYPYWDAGWGWGGLGWGGWYGGYGHGWYGRGGWGGYHGGGWGGFHGGEAGFHGGGGGSHGGGSHGR